MEKGCKEYIHRELGLNENYLANAKTVNYLENSLIADYSRSRGGFRGIKIDKEGNLLEGSISNIAFVMKDKSFVYPPLEKTIRGNTLSKVKEILEKDLMGTLVERIEERDVNLKELGEVKEMFHLSNDKVSE